MSLIDKLQAIEDFPSSHAAVTGNVLELLGKLIAYAEHGEALLQAAERDREARAAGEPATDVAQLLSDVPPEKVEQPGPVADIGPTGTGQSIQPPVPAPAAATPPPAAADVELPPETLPAETDQERVDRLRQELQTAEAQLGHPQVTVDPAAPAAPDVATPPTGAGWQPNPPQGV